MSKFKEGDEVVLITEQTAWEESQNYAKLQGLVVGDTYKIDCLDGDRWIRIDYNNLRYYHPASKFKLKIKKTKAHLPSWW